MDSRKRRASDDESESSSSEDERRHSRKHKSEKKSKKHEKSKKHKKERKHSKGSSKEKEALEYLLKHGKLTIPELSDDDFYRHNAEFRQWLKEERNILFSDLLTEQSKALFSKFVDAWNSHELPVKYYTGKIDHEVSAHRTQHKWSFASKLDPVEMGTLKDNVDSLTESNAALLTTEPSSAVLAKKPARTIGPSLPPPGIAASISGFDIPEDLEKHEVKDWMHEQAKKDRRAQRKEQEERLEELVPKETGREAMLQKKRERSEYTRRTRSPEMEEYNDADLMGGDDFKKRLREEKERQARREAGRQQRGEQHQQEIDARRKAYQQKEQATLEMFRAMAKNHKLGPSAQPPT